MGKRKKTISRRIVGKLVERIERWEKAAKDAVAGVDLLADILSVLKGELTKGQDPAGESGKPPEGEAQGEKSTGDGGLRFPR